MTPGLARRSPLEGVRLADGIRELPFLAQFDVRVDLADPAAVAAIELVVGPLPRDPNTVSGGADAAVLWLAPDEWLVVGPPGGEAALVAQLGDALADRPASVAIVDVSANRTTIELTGPRAREILEFGCSIDLHPRAFGPGRCAQTLIARASVVLWQVDHAPTYRLLVRPSFAVYLAGWLADARSASGVGLVR